MTALPILTAPDPILEQEAAPVESTDESIPKLMSDMFETMRTVSGIGLAAPQVGVSKQLFVVDLSISPSFDYERPRAFINPKIYYYSKEKSSAEEGCLSLPNYQVGTGRPSDTSPSYLQFNVSRSSEIMVRYHDKDWTPKVLSADGWMARVIQHEYDHLSGKLISDTEWQNEEF